MDAMTGNSFGTVTPKTRYEMIDGTIVMVLGATFYGKIFADFGSLIWLMNQEEEDIV